MRCSKISRESESALISLLPTLFDMLNLLSIAAQTITKGGLISERFSIWLKSQEKRCQITTLSTIHQREDARCCNFFKDLRNNEKCSEIKLPLSTYLFFRLLKIDSARVKIGPEASVNNQPVTYRKLQVASRDTY